MLIFHMHKEICNKRFNKKKFITLQRINVKEEGWPSRGKIFIKEIYFKSTYFGLYIN